MLERGNQLENGLDQIQLLKYWSKSSHAGSLTMYSPGAAELRGWGVAQDAALEAGLPRSQNQEYMCHVFASTTQAVML